MRQTIESAPRDQEDIILEDDASGTFDVAHWSPEAGKWIRENGERSKITPTHWYPIPANQYLERSTTSSHTGRARLRFAALSITAAFILAGLYFQADTPIWVTRNAGQQNPVGAGATGAQELRRSSRPRRRPHRRRDNRCRRSRVRKSWRSRLPRFATRPINPIYNGGRPPRMPRNRSNRSAKKRRLSRLKPPPHDRNGRQARSNNATCSRKNALAQPHWRASSRWHAARSRPTQRN